MSMKPSVRAESILGVNYLELWPSPNGQGVSMTVADKDGEGRVQVPGIYDLDVLKAAVDVAIERRD